MTRRVRWLAVCVALGMVAAACSNAGGTATAPAEGDATTTSQAPDGGDASTTTATSTAAPWDGFEGRDLNVVTWGGAWTEASEKHVFGPFSEETGVNVNFIVSGTDPTATVKLQVEQNAVQIDLGDSLGGARLEVEGMLEHFPPELVTALEETSRPGTVEDYVLNYGTTATLIVCNPDLVDRCPTNAAEFWDVEAFPGDRAIAASFSSALGFGALAAGADPGNLLPLDLDAAVGKLEEIKPHIKVWPDSGAMQEQVMVDREVGIAYMWNGRAFVVKRDSLPQLEFYWDDSTVSDGGGYSVPKGAPNADVAFAFLYWIAAHPEAQAGWTEALTYPMPHKDLLEMVSPEIAAALPSSHNPAVLTGQILAEQESVMQRAWQEFLTGN